MLAPDQRARLREWYQAATASRSVASASFVPDQSAVSVSVERGPSFRIPTAVRGEFEIHFLNSEYAAEVAAFLREAVSPGVLFDVGANNGLFSLLFCGLHACNRAFGYEPSPAFADRAEAIVRLNGLEERLQIIRKAVADTGVARQFLIDEQTGRVQVMQFAGTVRESWVDRSMTTTTLDAEAARVGSPSLIKIDVEGFEWEVLQGATQLLERVRPVIILELHLNFLEERGVPPFHVAGLLERHDYELRDLSGQRLSGRHLARSWASVLHVVAAPRVGRSA
jgi:FkbM family methyltransferase